jgi:hypothetical protein
VLAKAVEHTHEQLKQAAQEPPAAGLAPHSRRRTVASLLFARSARLRPA